MKKLDQTPTFYTKKDAIRVAAELGADDPDWAYVPKHDPKGTGYSFIEIYDEDGELVAKL